MICLWNLQVVWNCQLVVSWYLNFTFIQKSFVILYLLATCSLRISLFSFYVTDTVSYLTNFIQLIQLLTKRRILEKKLEEVVGLFFVSEVRMSFINSGESGKVSLSLMSGVLVAFNICNGTGNVYQLMFYFKRIKTFDIFIRFLTRFSAKVLSAFDVSVFMI